MYQQYLKVPSILHSPQFLVLLIIFTLAILVHLKGYLIVTLICSFSKDPWCFIIFSCTCWSFVCVCILWRLCSSISHFLMVYLSSYWDIVYIFWIPVFCKMYILQVVFYDTLLLSWSLIFSSFSSFLRWKFRSLIWDCLTVVIIKPYVVIFPPQNGITGLYDNWMYFFDVNMYGRIVPSKPCFGNILQILICCEFKVNFCYGQILCEASSFKFIGT